MNLPLKSLWSDALDPNQAQIVYTSPAGQALIQAANAATTIVDVGAWHGLGSTYCIYLALERPEQVSYSIEPNPDCCREAASHYTHDPRMRFLNGTTLSLLDQLPKTIDLLVLDGAEGSESLREYQALAPRLTRYLFLDDVREDGNKNAQTLTAALSDGWVAKTYAPRDRNGWALLRKPFTGHQQPR